MRLQVRFLLAVLGLSLTFAPAAFGHGSGEKPPGSLLLQKASGEKAFPDTGSFVNYEIPHVNPIALGLDNTLAACNTPDGTVEIFTIDGSGNITHSDTIRVGYAPVSVRYRTFTEIWVVNHMSDTISIVDISKGQEVDVIHTYDGYDGVRAGDEPADVVFVTNSFEDDFALVSCSRSDVIQRYDPDTRAYIDEFRLDGEDPRMLAVGGLGDLAYVAIFESGNGTTSINRTAIGGGGPYAGQNPPFNNGIPGSAWVADGMAITPGDFTAVGSPQPPPVTLIVRKDAGGAWRDDNGADWTQWVSGASAGLSGRIPDWDLIDNDVAGFSGADDFTSATYATRLMNHVMAVAIEPGLLSPVVSVGTDATNEIRFEPNITGTFTRVILAQTDDNTGALLSRVDLNAEHLDIANGGTGDGALAYVSHNVPQNVRDQSIGDPRGIALLNGIAYITGMGSNNVVGFNLSTNRRISVGHAIDLGPKQGPTGIVQHSGFDRLYVLNKFGANVMTIDATTPGSETVIDVDSFYDPTPDFINDGRVHLYDTHASSGLGQIACASCHVDARMDRLAWDLGNPAGGDPLGVERVINTQDILSGNSQVWNFIFGAGTQHGAKVHTMKGPMTTQTLQDIIQHEPFHWRGDRDGLEEFAGAFAGLQGDDQALAAGPMQDFEDFLSTIHFPPNTFRALDNSLPGGPQLVGGSTNPDLPLPGFVSPGDIPSKGDSFSPAGTQLPNGNAWQGFDDYVDNFMDVGAINCVTCHALPMGSGPITRSDGTPIPLGPEGQSHVGMTDNDGTGQVHIKIPQLRNQFDKEGFFTNQFLAAPFDSRAGFGTVHNGELAGGLGRFLGSAVFQTFTDQDLADIIAFTLCINGGGFDDLFALGGAPSLGSPDGGPENTAHAAIGHQVLITSGVPPMADQDTIDLLVTLADQDKIGLIATGAPSGNRASWYHVSGTGGAAIFRSDNDTTVALSSLQGLATVANPITFMAVPAVSDVRMGVDRDDDSLFNGEELDLNSNSKNPNDVKWIDLAAGAGGDGSESNPYNSILAGLLTLQRTPGKNGVLRLEAGNYPSGTISAPRTILKAENGVVRFGL